MDKILQSVSTIDGNIQVTNDGATILKAIDIDNAAAKILVDIAKIQDDEVGDGTTSVVVFAGELLREGEKLIDQRIHPMIIIDGWRIARDAAIDALEKSAVDNSGNDELFREELMNIARTTLSSKLLTFEKELFAKLAVDAVLRIGKDGELDHIQIIKKCGGTLKDSFLADGFILDKTIGVGQPRKINNAKILIANTPMDTDKIKIYGSRVRVDSLNKVAEIEEAEKMKMKSKCEKIINYGINCFINRQLIYNYPEQIFTDHGIMSIEHADFDGIERLAAVLGGEITSTFDHPELAKLGNCECIEEIIIGEDKLIQFKGCKSNKACSIVLRGASKHVLDEADRSLHDALSVLQQTLKNPKRTLGGGCAEMVMAEAVDEIVPTINGKKALAVEAFARALRRMPMIIADNAGLDSSELVAKLRAEHHKGNHTYGIDINKSDIGDVAKLGIMEALKLKRQVIISGSEAAEMIMRVDQIIKCAPRQREDPRKFHH